MKKVMIFALFVSFTLLLFSGASNAQSTPAAKATAKVGAINILDATSMEWTTIMSRTIKMTNMKGLFFNVALECGLYTRTRAGKTASVDTSTGEAGIQVRVIVDDVEAAPGTVMFRQREQTLTPYLAGILVGTTVQDPYVELILKTMETNSFNFIAADLPAGVHTVQVQAKIYTSTSGIAEARATIGKGSVAVEEVRMIRGEDFEL